MRVVGLAAGRYKRRPMRGFPPLLLLIPVLLLSGAGRISAGVGGEGGAARGAGWKGWDERRRVPLERPELLATMLRESLDLDVERTGPEIASALQRIVRGEFDPELSVRWTESYQERELNQYDAESRRLLQSRENFEAAALGAGASDPESLLDRAQTATDGTEVIPLPDGTGIQFANADEVNRLADAFEVDNFAIRDFEERLRGGRAGITQLLPTGTRLEAFALQQGLENSLTTERSVSGFPLSPFYPRQTEVLGRVQVTQPLLRNFGFPATLVQVRIARADKRRADAEFLASIHRRVAEVLGAYYDLAFSLEQVGVEQQSVHAASVLVGDNRKRLEEGVVDVSEVGRAETSLAEREDRLLAAQRRALEAQARVLRLSRREATTYDAPVLLVPTEGLAVEEPPARTATDVLVSARVARPELAAAREVIDASRHRLGFYRNQLLPELNLTGGYGYRGLGADPDDAWSRARDGDNHEWAVGVEVRMPLGNHEARGGRDRAAVLLTRAERELVRLEADVTSQAVIALDGLHMHHLRVLRAAEGRRAGEATYRAERRLFDEGKSTTYLVLDALQNARTTHLLELAARLEYRRAAIQLELAEGSILRRNGLVWEAPEARR
jgi:outer membrane protein TolC